MRIDANQALLPLGTSGEYALRHWIARAALGVLSATRPSGPIRRFSPLLRDLILPSPGLSLASHNDSISNFLLTASRVSARPVVTRNKPLGRTIALRANKSVIFTAEHDYTRLFGENTNRSEAVMKKGSLPIFRKHGGKEGKQRPIEDDCFQKQFL